MFRMIALLLLGMQTANAVMITVDADNYAIGTNLSNIQDGVSVSFLNWPGGAPTGSPPERDPAIVSSCISSGNCPSPSDDVGFGMTHSLESYNQCVAGSSVCRFGVRALELTFHDLTDAVSLVFTFRADDPILWAYDINGVLIDSCRGWGTGSSSCAFITPISQDFEHRAMLSINHGERDIYRVVAGGYSGNSYAQSFSYSVPEPGTLGLFGLGLLALVRRRKLT